MGYIKGISTGIRHHPWMSFIYLFASFSVLLTLVEGFTYFIPSLDLRGIKSLTAVVVISVIYTAAAIRRPSKIEIPIHHTNTRIEIKFGDIFTEEGLRAIPVSEFFESAIGLPVSPKSLHGIFLSKCFAGHKEVFDRHVDEELKDTPGEEVAKPHGKKRRYPVGTTVLIPVNNDRYLCFALTRTDITTCKVSSDVPTLWKSLSGLWQKARISLGGHALLLPLVGSGLSGIGLPPKELLNLMILSIIEESKIREITPHIRIVLIDDLFNEIDLKELERYWR
jgi:hypothetical protein